MRLLLDANLSPQLVTHLGALAVDAIHVQVVGLLRASDDEIFAYATQHQMVVVTADTDFPMMLALRQTHTPSVVLLRGIAELSPSSLASLLAENLGTVADKLDRGAVVSLSTRSLRWRQLPLIPDQT